MAPAVILNNVAVNLGGQTILTDVNAEIPAHQTTAIIGPNGAGKTTLLRVILDQVPFSGDVQFGGPDAPQRPRIGYIPQRLDMDRDAPIRVADFLCAQLQRRPLWLGLSRPARRAALEALERVGASALWSKRLGVLSGGELQRVLLALALTLRPHVLLMDEPMAGVDIAGQGLFCDLLASLQQELSCTMVLVLHELTVVAQHADYVLCLNNQRIMCQGRTLETLTVENLRAVLGTHLSLYHHHGPHGGHECEHEHGTPPAPARDETRT